ncbi:MAG TPA: ArsR family transcriptional regulator [Nitrospirae bacterium]|nr:ArsR family transcriptional regulator [Nitrospirota bacterium]
MKDITLLFKALSDETRIRILSLMQEGELCVCDIAETLQMTQPNISFHVSLLKEAGLIKDRKNGRWIHYSLDDSDMFKRFLLLGVFEKIGNKPAKKIKKSNKC